MSKGTALISVFFEGYDVDIFSLCMQGR